MLGLRLVLGVVVAYHLCFWLHVGRAVPFQIRVESDVPVLLLGALGDEAWLLNCDVSQLGGNARSANHPST